MKENKKNGGTYRRMGMKMLLGGLLGGALGFAMYFILEIFRDGVEVTAASLLAAAQSLILPALLLVFVLSVAAGELFCRRLKGIYSRMETAEDEERDWLDYEEERQSALLLNCNIASQAVSILILSLGYSRSYLIGTAGVSKSFLLACLVFLACFVYDGMAQMRYIKMAQKNDPRLKGDPTSGKYLQQVLEASDEAEREIIYRSAYRAYAVLNKWIPALLLLTMLGQLFFDTGVMAVFVVALLWMVVALTYTRSCVALKEKKALTR